MIMKKLVNGVEVDCTEQDIAQINALNSEWEAGALTRMVDAYTKALEKAIDDKAAERSYSSAISCASYKDSTNAQWSAEAVAFIVWRDNCYEYSYDYLAQAQGGQIPNPSIDNFIAGLPAMEWPTVNP